jgi:uncharacterized protein
MRRSHLVRAAATASSSPTLRAPFPAGPIRRMPSARNFSAAITGDATLLRYGAAYFPYLETDLPLRIPVPRVRLSGFDIVTVARDGSESVAAVPGWRRTQSPRCHLRLRTKEPAVYRAVRTFLRDARASVPPSGAVAGLYARVDATQGVWKAPAGQALLKVVQPAVP